MIFHRPMRMVLIAVTALAVTGCKSGAPKEATNEIRPVDFIGQRPALAVKPAANAPAPAAPANSASTTPAVDTAPLPLPAPAAPPVGSTPPTNGETTTVSNALVVDAMVGQVNGKPIYASEIFKSIGEDTLHRFGDTETRLGFKARAQELIYAKLRERVTNSLILAEAERGLGEREQLGLLGWLKSQRERRIAELGGGVLAVAEQTLQNEKGYGLDQEMENIRQRALVDKFLHEKLYPKINVERREVERYYEDHNKDFNSNPSITVRMIMTDAAGADAVDAALKGGMKFEDAAKKFSIMSNAEKGGLMGPYSLSGPLQTFNELRSDELNAKVRTLKVGDHSDRTPITGGFGWVMLEKMEGGESKTLQQAFLEIESRIRTMKFSRLQQKYIGDLMNSGNFTPLDQMRSSLLEVAMARFARTQ